MSFTTILHEIQDGVATITLNRPEVLNAVNTTMARELHELFAQISRDRSVRAALLTGAGRAFCGGADLVRPGGGVAMDDPNSIRDWLTYLNGLIVGIMEMQVCWVAAVNGPAAGMGVHLALACDLVVMAERAYFYEAFLARGLAVDVGGMYLLPRLAGLHRAKELAFFCEKVYGPKAVELGLANRAVPDSELMAFARGWASRLAQGPTRAMGLTKQGMNRGLSMSLWDVLSYEAQAQALATQTQDVREGIRAFLEKREPMFRGY
ncbi:MAG: enoyl-CoA hydratase-related protein [Armatimonadota bacterium]|nr:enoyl-CoA hydratase-related protein [Armatimonadota bacterium]MDR7469505.1 enoyl-CoA hydratase-related protein [Armatimonadota bacterium]MDR7475456.1 enoyl-CoA hydratase-related protein [Armatimonadota bacterium]